MLTPRSYHIDTPCPLPHPIVKNSTCAIHSESKRTEAQFGVTVRAIKDDTLMYDGTEVLFGDAGARGFLNSEQQERGNAANQKKKKALALTQ